MREQGQGSIRQRGPQHWELKFDLGRDPASGKRITRYVTFHGTKREAQAELNRLLTRRSEGTYVDPTKMSLGEYLEHWLTVDIDRRVAAKTAWRHRQIVRHQIIPRLGNIPLRKLTAVHIEAAEAELAQWVCEGPQERAGADGADGAPHPSDPFAGTGARGEDGSVVQEPRRASEATKAAAPRSCDPHQAQRGGGATGGGRHGTLSPGAGRGDDWNEAGRDTWSALVGH